MDTQIDRQTHTHTHTHRHTINIINITYPHTRVVIIEIKNKAVTPKWVTTSFRSDTIVFNENRIASVIAELLKRCADAWCKQALIDVEGLGL